MVAFFWRAFSPFSVVLSCNFFLLLCSLFFFLIRYACDLCQRLQQYPNCDSATHTQCHAIVYLFVFVSYASLVCASLRPKNYIFFLLFFMWLYLSHNFIVVKPNKFVQTVILREEFNTFFVLNKRDNDLVESLNTNKQPRDRIRKKKTKSQIDK